MESETSPEAIVAYIFGENASALAVEFHKWVKTSEGFRAYAYMYRDKIRKKIQHAQRMDKDPEQIQDVRFELEIGYQLNKSPDFTQVEYEKYGDREAGPDFTAMYRMGTLVNIEVKRIRETDLEVRLDQWIHRIGAGIDNIPSALGVSVDIDIPDGSNHAEFMKRLEHCESEVLQLITNIIKNVNSLPDVEEDKPYPIPGFEEEIILRITKPPKKLDPIYTSYYGGSHPVFLLTDKDNRPGGYLKFGDAICQKLHQTRSGYINVLIITTSSNVRHSPDLFDAIDSLNTLIIQGNELFFAKKGFKGIEDFVKQSRYLSGVLFHSGWGRTPVERNALWRNRDADYPIDDDLANSLRNLA